MQRFKASKIRQLGRDWIKLTIHHKDLEGKTFVRKFVPNDPQGNQRAFDKSHSSLMADRMRAGRYELPLHIEGALINGAYFEPKSEGHREGHVVFPEKKGEFISMTDTQHTLAAVTQQDDAVKADTEWDLILSPKDDWMQQARMHSHRNGKGKKHEKSALVYRDYITEDLSVHEMAAVGAMELLSEHRPQSNLFHDVRLFEGQSTRLALSKVYIQLAEVAKTLNLEKAQLADLIDDYLEGWRIAYGDAWFAHEYSFIGERMGKEIILHYMPRVVNHLNRSRAGSNRDSWRDLFAAFANRVKAKTTIFGRTSVKQQSGYSLRSVVEACIAHYGGIKLFYLSDTYGPIIAEYSRYDADKPRFKTSKVKHVSKIKTTLTA